jgi:hypothetical protein
LRVVNLRGAGEGLGASGGGGKGGDASDAQQRQKQLEANLEQAGNIVFFDGRGTGLDGDVERALLWDDGPGGEGGLTAGGGRGGRKTRLSAGAMAGVVVGCLVLVGGLVGVGVWCFVVRRRRRRLLLGGGDGRGTTGAAFGGDVEVVAGGQKGKAAVAAATGSGAASATLTPASAAVEAGLGHQGVL